MALVASLRLSVIGRMAATVTGVFVSLAGVTAVAVASISLSLPHGRSTFAPALRASEVPPLEGRAGFDLGRAWREEYAQLAPPSTLMPKFALSMLVATNFPAADAARSPDIDIAAPLPPPRPDGIARASVARTMPLAIEPQVASLPPQPEQPGILDKLFGDPDRAAKAVLAANPNVALYDITRRAVYLPDGEKLEAHSGFGQFMDDPTSVARKDLGVTPPNIYAVSFREKPFHGVRALRMKPVGSGNMYGRDGILAHSYLLGAEGASNGCLSVRDYDKFLQAFEAGKFNQIIVVRSVDEPLPAVVASSQPGGA
ncbi:DUF2778 domain-containing protein [Pseudolabrys sp. Root1462]|uniref:DUF2778 domain-containing protein n=1 Tax=Pseudolabrys sp. Root1462 TaxID=1736466 RepID=UPI000AF1D4B4|nr:DUF2778 domain-containing protein [Pseudolabrys sp. Root1462]